MEQQQTPFEQALNQSAPKSYADGYYVQLGWHDVSISLHHLGKPLAIVTMPQGVAKALAAQINSSLQVFQENTGAQIFTAEELERMLQKHVPAAQKGESK
jgi:hypothetical protein